MKLDQDGCLHSPPPPPNLNFAFVSVQVHKSCKAKCYKVCDITLTTLAVSLCIVLAPLVALLASFLVFPLSLLYFYCFIPIHLCAQS